MFLFFGFEFKILFKLREKIKICILVRGCVVIRNWNIYLF